MAGWQVSLFSCRFKICAYKMFMLASIHQFHWVSGYGHLCPILSVASNFIASTSPTPRTKQSRQEPLGRVGNKLIKCWWFWRNNKLRAVRISCSSLFHYFVTDISGYNRERGSSSHEHGRWPDPLWRSWDYSKRRRWLTASISAARGRIQQWHHQRNPSRYDEYYRCIICSCVPTHYGGIK